MLMLSSSSTSPRSSRPTMLSSSLRAFSNDMSLMSRCFPPDLAMSLFITLPLNRWRGCSGTRLHQYPDVDANRLCQGGEVVAAFEHRHQPPLSVLRGNLGDLVGRPSEIGSSNRRLARGSSAWASNPAEISTTSGEKLRRAGRMRASKASLNRSPASPGLSGAFQMLPTPVSDTAPVPG